MISLIKNKRLYTFFSKPSIDYDENYITIVFNDEIKKSNYNGYYLEKASFTLGANIDEYRKIIEGIANDKHIFLNSDEYIISDSAKELLDIIFRDFHI